MKEHIKMELRDNGFNGNWRDYLIEKGVENPEDFLKADSAYQYDPEPTDFFNMKEAINLTKDYIKEHKKFGIVVDQDFDGYASSGMMYRLLKNEGADVVLISGNRKIHGIDTLRQDILMDYDIDLLFIPDGGINDYDSIQNLVAHDIQVIVLDHHLINEPDKVNNLGAYMVSSQNPNNTRTNENLTGAGMVAQFVIGFYGHIDTVSQVLMALGQIADVSDTSDIYIRGCVIRGLEHINEHPFIKVFELEEPVYQSTIGWNVSPLINAVSRFGTLENRIDIVKALSATLSEEKDEVVEKRKKNKETGKFDKVGILVNQYDKAHDMAKKVKSEQEKEMNKTMKEIQWLIEPKKNNVAVALIPLDKNSAVTGLIANKLQSKYSQPVLVGRNVNSHFWGSLRSPGQFPFSTWANDTGLITAIGHEQAAGANFDINLVSDIKTVSKELDFNNHPRQVDIIFDKYVDTNLINRINEKEDLFGGVVNKPLVGIKNLTVDKTHINLKKSMLSFNLAGIQFVMFKAENIIDYIQYETGFNSELHLDIVADVSQTSWGKIMPQLIIQDIAISTKKTDKKEPLSFDNFEF